MASSINWNQMYDYIGKGNTIYDYIGEYLPELNGDFSVENMRNNYNLISEKSIEMGYGPLVELGDTTNSDIILENLYLYVRTVLKNKIPEEERVSGKSEEWDRMEFIRAIINNPKKLQEYNEYLEKAQPRLEAIEKKEKTKIKCEVLRSKVVNEEIKKSLTEEQVAAYEEEGISAIFPTSYRSQLWKPDRAEWSFIKFAEPEVVATSPVIYSKGGMENQIVAAVSYGKLFLKNGEISNYSKDISQDSLFCQPDLVGITKIGRDGISTYFVVMPLDAIKFSEEKADTEKGEKDVYIFLNGNKKSTPIYEYSNGEKKKMFAINTRKIQPETMDGYVKVLFSDTYLQGARQFNGGYAGYITKSPSEVLGEDDGKPKYQIVTSDVGMVELEGTRFAFNNPGISALSYPRVIRTKKNEEYDTHRIGKIYGERNVSSLEKVCEELATEHLRLVKDITNGEFDFSGKEDAKTSEKPEGPEGQEPFED